MKTLDYLNTKLNENKDFFNRFLPFISKFKKDRVSLYATQAVFYFIISAVPFLIFILSLLKYIYPISQDEFMVLIAGALPNSLQYWLIKVLNSIYTESTVSLTSIAALTTLWSASKSTYALTQGLTEIYESTSYTSAIKNRFSSILYTLLLAVLLTLFMTIEIFSAPIISLIRSYTPDALNWLIRILNVPFFLSYILVSLVFAFLYMVLSKSKIKFIYHLPGALIASVSWLVFSYIYEIYINNFANFSITYGSLAAIIIMMLWLKICMNIFLLGGEFNVYLYFYKPLKKEQ